MTNQQVKMSLAYGQIGILPLHSQAEQILATAK